jgi:hypothetical protein
MCGCEEDTDELGYCFYKSNTFTCIFIEEEGEEGLCLQYLLSRYNTKWLFPFTYNNSH